MRTDPEAFVTWVHERAPALGRLAYQLTHDRTAAEDLVQDVLLTAYRRWDRVQRADSSHAYLRAMVVHHHLNARRRQPVTTRWPDHVEVADPAAPLDAVVERDGLWQGLARLSDRQRAVLVLRHYEQCDDAEIAAVLRCRRATVRSLAARGLAALRDDLGTDPREDPGHGSHDHGDGRTRSSRPLPFPEETR